MVKCSVHQPTTCDKKKATKSCTNKWLSVGDVTLKGADRDQKKNEKF